MNEFLLPEKKAQLEREREEIEKEFQTDETSVENIEIEKLSVEEIEAEKFEWLSKRFGEFLQKNKKMKGVILFYADDLEETAPENSGIWFKKENRKFPTNRKFRRIKFSYSSADTVIRFRWNFG